MKTQKPLKKILIIEDHETLRLSLHSWLSEIYPKTEIETAASGEHGLLIANATNPDIAIIDIGLPGINGIDVTEKILNSPLTTDVIVLTMNAGLEYEHKALEAGAKAFINKKEMYKLLPSVIQSLL